MGEIIPNDNDRMLTAHYTELSHIFQRIVSKGSRRIDVFSLSKSLWLEVGAKIEASIASEEENMQNVNKIITVETFHNSISNMHEEPQLRDPTKRRSKGQSSKRIKGPF
ncbi:protein FAR1-RELATED SEQUENCE 5-like [Forsythia ovata]|uniref:Protein FAR1-RELATED SEQUENCE 5-like n=1 Tax=Forsythia ovata TaxID=205694 RepID=A0ABD1T5J5_9LAMI